MNLSISRNLIYIILILSIMVNIIISVEQKIDNDKINTSTNTSEKKPHEIINFYNFQQEAFRNISSKCYTHMHKLYLTTITHYGKISKYFKPKNDNTADCFRTTKNKIIDAFKNSTKNNAICLIDNLYLFEDFFESMIMSLNVKGDYPYCYVDRDSILEILNCLDYGLLHEINPVVRDNNILLKFVQSEDDSFISRTNQCTNETRLNFEKSVNRISYEFEMCLEEKLIDNSDTDHNKTLQIFMDSTISNAEKNSTLVNLYNKWLNFLRLEDSHIEIIENYKRQLTVLNKNSPETTIPFGYNITCCLKFSKWLMDKSVTNILDTTKKCSTDKSISLMNFVNSFIKDYSFKSSFDNCVGNNHQLPEIFRCLDDTVSNKTNSVKMIYNVFKNDMNKKVDFFISTLNECLNESADIFSRFQSYSNTRFNLCSRSQKYKDKCVYEFLDSYDLEILLSLHVITTEEYNYKTLLLIKSFTFSSWKG